MNQKGRSSAGPMLEAIRWIGGFRPYDDVHLPLDRRLERSRQGLVLLGFVYAPWALLAREGIWDPFLVRMVAGAVALGFLALSYRAGSWVQRDPARALALAATAVVTQYYFVLYVNELEIGYVYAVFPMVLLLSCMQSATSLLPFTLYNLFMVGLVAGITPYNEQTWTFFLIGMACCALAYIVVGGFVRLVGDLELTRNQLAERISERTQELSQANEFLREQLTYSRALNEMTERIAQQDRPAAVIASFAEIAGPALGIDLVIVSRVPADANDAEVSASWVRPGFDLKFDLSNQLKLDRLRQTLDSLRAGPCFVESHGDAPGATIAEDDASTWLHEERQIQSTLGYSFDHRATGFRLASFATFGQPRSWSPIALDFVRGAARHAQISLEKMEILREWRLSQDALLKSESQLRQAQKMEAVGRLAGGMAHDFNNLLTAIRGYASLLLESLEEADPRREDVAEIQQASERGANVIEQLLSFSRQDSAAPSAIDLNQQLVQLEGMLRRLIGQRVELCIETADRPAKVLADAGQIEQMLLNLAANARDAMPDGGRLSLSVDVMGKGDPTDRVVLRVADTGTGIAEDAQALIFEPFFTTKEVGKGTGLGLSLVYSAVKQSGGEIRVESDLGCGTRFVIDLPYTDRPLASASAAELPRGRPGGSEVVLLIEDEGPVRRLAARVLRAAGYRVLEGSNGDEAREVLAEHAGHVDLLVTDVAMPGLSGPELAEELRGERPDLGVLFMSGYAEPRMHGGLDLPSDAPFLPKPFSPDALCAMVRSVLDDSASADA